MFPPRARWRDGLDWPVRVVGEPRLEKAPVEPFQRRTGEAPGSRLGVFAHPGPRPAWGRRIGGWAAYINAAGTRAADHGPLDRLIPQKGMPSSAMACRSLTVRGS